MVCFSRVFISKASCVFSSSFYNSITSFNSCSVISVCALSMCLWWLWKPPERFWLDSGLTSLGSQIKRVATRPGTSEHGSKSFSLLDLLSAS
jgi:hypothetical protein